MGFRTGGSHCRQADLGLAILGQGSQSVQRWYPLEPPVPLGASGLRGENFVL